MSDADRKLLLCDCEGSQPIDPARLGAERVHSSLCRRELAATAKALQAAGGEVVLACAQEIARFQDLADELQIPRAPLFVDIRDRAGWSEEAGDAGPKMAALLAEAALPRPATPSLTIDSAGLCLVYGPAETALPAAERLADALSVTVMLTDADPTEALPPKRDIAVVAGRIRQAQGALGGFAVTVTGFAERIPGGRGGLAFEPPKNGAQSECDIILDLSGEAPLFPAHEKRDGYLRADPRDPLAIERALFEAAQLQGQFDKPLYVRLDETLCAHSRARQPGCDRCLSVCPTGAITVPDGGKSDHVAIDPLVCAGCGACAAVCPSGAATYDDPPLAFTLRRMRALAEAYRGAGGAAPRLLIHDDAHGAEMISLSARYGRGLPATTLPLSLEQIGAFGHVAMVAGLAMGFAEIRVLPAPKTDRAQLDGQIALARALAAGAGQSAERLAVLDVEEPDALSDALYAAAPEPLSVDPVLPLGESREVLRLAMKGLSAGSPPEAPIALAAADLGVELPGGAPYGATLVDESACTLCLSCVSLCPSGALGDNPDKPELRFQEAACLQCGICAQACPEDAITLAPRYDLSPAAMAYRTLKEEEPFHCIECGKPYGVKSTVERIVAKLRDKHPMFTGSDNTRLIQMCDDCRVNAQFKHADSPFQMGAPRKPRTTDDYLRERDEEKGES